MGWGRGIGGGKASFACMHTGRIVALTLISSASPALNSGNFRWAASICSACSSLSIEEARRRGVLCFCRIIGACASAPCCNGADEDTARHSAAFEEERHRHAAARVASIARAAGAWLLLSDESSRRKPLLLFGSTIWAGQRCRSLHNSRMKVLLLDRCDALEIGG